MTAFDETTAQGSGPVVLQVLPSLETGGAERGCVDVAKAVVDAGGTALVASSGGGMVRDLDRAGARHFNIPVHSKNPLRMRANVSKLMSIIREFGVDIVHARSRAPAWSCLKACQKTKAHFITTFHGTYNITSGLKRRYNAIMTQGERVIAISGFIAKHVTTEYETDPARIRIIHRGVDVERFDPAAVPAVRIVQLAEQWRLPDGVPVILMPGRLTRWKGQAVLIEAMAAMKDLDFRCLLVGGDQGRTGYRQELITMVKGLDLESKVHFVGHCEDMPAAYMLADVVVSASTDPEAFGRVMAEGQALGKPVIGADHGASGELIIPNETGWLVPPKEPAALAEALRRALALDTSAREKLATRAIANVRENFSRAQMCAKTLDVYGEVMEQAANTLESIERKSA
ncbi:MAG TPA: glycosyl transferase [Rhodospirillaceae bacterium]|nr:glycosyl transferase [Rhodospirillaceae bacterium]HAA92620.1 glycosyl transferase [Rhodospirillaceae bacterium]HAT36527.1 glycosyl transferase [Rhodospirillaceae bacterium]